MKKMKKFIAASTTALMVMSMSISAFAASITGARLTSQQATEIALAQTNGGTVTKSKLDRDDGMYIYEIKVQNGGYKYEFDVDATDGEILQYEKEVPVKERTRTNNMTTQEAASIALEKTGAGNVYKNTYSIAGGQAHYSVKVSGNDGFDYEVKINATTKEVYEYEKDGIKVYPNDPTSSSSNSSSSSSTPTSSSSSSASSSSSSSSSASSSSSNSTTSRLTAQEAQNIALGQTSGGTVTKSKLDRDDGMYIYEIKVQNGAYKYEFDIDATDGEILKYEKEIPVRERSRINNMTTEEAASIALEKTGAGNVYKNTFSLGGGQAHYSVKIAGNDGFDYELEINATTKEILEYEKDGIKRYDNNSNSSSSSNSSTGTLITVAQAQEIAFAKVGGGTLKKSKLDRDNGKYVYEIEIKNGKTEHEFKIDAYTGDILEYEIDD